LATSHVPSRFLVGRKRRRIGRDTIVGVLDFVAAFTAPRWAWTTTTVIGAVVTLSLIGILTAHILLAAMSGAGPKERSESPARIQRPLVIAAIPLLALLLVVICVRFGLLLAERPGR
jgi:hypothetical protein